METVRLWCVGVCYKGGEHIYRVFDSEQEAEDCKATMEYAQEVRRRTKHNQPIKLVVMWEM